MSRIALAAPSSLKGVLTAPAAADALAAGICRAPGWRAQTLPIADGGEGTAEVISRARGGSWRHAMVHDPLGRDVDARFLLLDGGTAVVDSAEAVGLGLLARAERDPLLASTAGLGELLAYILALGPSDVLVGVGGTATVDGGAGMLSVLPHWPSGVRLRVCCDVRNPLLGPRGAAAVYGPQKGANPAAVSELERRLEGIPRLRPVRDLPGAGAGGGLGAALAALGGKLCNGAELILDLTHFDEHASRAAVVITGEGTVDRTTLEGKAPGAVVSRCAKLGVPCVVFGGRVEDDTLAARQLSGEPARVVDDLTELGEQVVTSLQPDG